MLIGDYHIEHMAAANIVHTLEGWNRAFWSCPLNTIAWNIVSLW